MLRLHKLSPLLESCHQNIQITSYRFKRREEPIPNYKYQAKTYPVDEFHIHNKRGTRQFKREQFNSKRPKYPDVKIHHYGVRGTHLKHHFGVENCDEMIPELIVPDLEDCELKAYVSYATQDIYQDELTSQDLFNAIYGPKIVSDFKAGKLDDGGASLEPSEPELMQPEEAFIRARQTGSDIFQGGEPENKLWKLDIPVGSM